MLVHDFIHGFYHEDYFTGERISEAEYYRKQRALRETQKCQHYILIKTCDSKIRGEKTYYSITQWHYACNENPPENVVILSDKEYIKNEKRGAFYRSYSGNSPFSLEVVSNIKLKADKVEVIHGFFLCISNGKGTLYTKEAFQKEFLS